MYDNRSAFLAQGFDGDHNWADDQEILSWERYHLRLVKPVKDIFPQSRGWQHSSDSRLIRYVPDSGVAIGRKAK